MEMLDYLYTLIIWFHVERTPGGTSKQQINEWHSHMD